MQQYMIYESANVADISSVKSNGDVVEFITVLQEADVKNRNGRIYPKDVIDKALHSPLIEEKLRTHTLMGECGHPFDTNVARQTTVDLKNAAFMVEEFWWDGNLLKGKCKTLNTALGRDMAGLIKEGCCLSFSMRGQGSVTRDPMRDALVVQSPLMLITWDWVWLPSHQTAYMESICEETKASMFKTEKYNNMQMALNESMNLYENGSLIAIGEEKQMEKPMIDYYANYTKAYKTVNETYFYDPEDKIIEANAKYLILENARCKKKVAKQDYLLKSIREDIAALDVPATPAVIKPTRPKTDDEDSPSANPLEKKVEDAKKENPEIKDVSSDVKVDAVKNNVEEGNPDVDTKDVVDTVDSAEDVDSKKADDYDKEALKEEFYKYYNIISEETGLTEEADIINTALLYKEYLSEGVAYLFEQLSKED